MPSDPDQNRCDEECGIFASGNTSITQQVLCRRQCVPPDLNGMFIHEQPKAMIYTVFWMNNSHANGRIVDQWTNDHLFVPIFRFIFNVQFIDFVPL